MDVIFLLAKAKNSAGSFRPLKEGEPVRSREHRHDRGWPHSNPRESELPLPDKRRWKTVGILHFVEETGGEDDDDGERSPG